MEWIPISQYLPTGEDHLLCVYEGAEFNPRMVVGYWNRLTDCWMVNQQRIPSLIVTHSQLLPDPPENVAQ